MPLPVLWLRRPDWRVRLQPAVAVLQALLQGPVQRRALVQPWVRLRLRCLRLARVLRQVPVLQQEQALRRVPGLGLGLVRVHPADLSVRLCWRMAQVPVRGLLVPARVQEVLPLERVPVLAAASNWFERAA